MKKLLLIRHGQQIRGKDEGLTEMGQMQASLTGHHLAARKAREGGIAGLYGSDLKRAAETAKRIGDEIGENPNTTPLLRERMNWGDINPDEPFEEFSHIWRQTLADRTLKFPGREASIESGERLNSFLQSLPDSEFPYIVIAHGGLFAELLRNEFSMDEISAKMPHFPNIGEKGWKGFSHCSLSELLLDDEGKYHIEELNFMEHIATHLGKEGSSAGHIEEGSVTSGENKEGN